MNVCMTFELLGGISGKMSQFTKLTLCNGAFAEYC